MTKAEVNDMLRSIFEERFVGIWWNIRLFAGKSANEVWETDPQHVIDRVKLYIEGE
jgi:hypothetical protein